MPQLTLTTPILANADQFLVNLKQSIVGLFPEAFQPLLAIMLTIIPITICFATLFALVTWMERKGLGRIQNRMGPNRVGLPFTKTRLFGLGQPIADGIKMLIKEDVVPRNSDKLLHFIAPVLLLIPSFLAFSVIPYGDGIVPIDLDAGLLFFFAIGASTELVIFCAGWASRNKYALLGAMRAIAQMISYELPLIISTFGVIMAVGSLSLVDIVNNQSGYFWNWHVFTPWGLAGFILFFISSLAEANRSPFDIPEGESEIIAGHLIEILRIQIRAVLHGRVSWDVRDERIGDRTFPRWVPRAIRHLERLRARAGLVSVETAGDDRGVHLDSRNHAALAHGSTHELRVEVHVADVAASGCFGRHVEAARKPDPDLAGGHCHHRRSLLCVESRVVRGPWLAETNVSIR